MLNCIITALGQMTIMKSQVAAQRTECAVTKSCFMPKSCSNVFLDALKHLSLCTFQPESCSSAATYQLDGKDVVIELMRTLPSASADVYVSFGVSEKKDTMVC